MKINFNRIRIINFFIVVLLIYLPYYLFDGKLFIGGDDSRLFYAFPDLWLKNIAWYSWFRLSTEGQHNPQQFMVPLLVLLEQLRKFLPQLVVANLAFSGPLVFGFLYFQKLFKTISRLDNNDPGGSLAGLLGALFYIMSPIIWIMTISPFLYSVWLIVLFPALLYYFLMYFHSGRLKYCIYGALAGVILSLGLYSIPWILGALLPLSVGMLVYAIFYSPSEVRLFVFRFGVFALAVGTTQVFAFLPFFASIVDSSGSFARQAMSSAVQNTFEPTVIATMFNNNILFPLANLFHRSIVFDFSWPIKAIFERVYDKLLILDLVFIFIVVSALIFRRSYLGPEAKLCNRRPYNIFLLAWIVSLFLFTVNIGSFRDLFLGLGNIPGFQMFRNAFDKFSIGYVFIYAVLFSFSFHMVYMASRRWNRFASFAVIFSCAFVILGNSLPLKEIVRKKLWTTNTIETVITFPDEYVEFMEKLPAKVQPVQSILSLPFAFPGYTVIKETDSNAVFAGTSPIKMFTGLDDFSGAMSLTPSSAKRFIDAIRTQNEHELRLFLAEYNIGYVLLTHNIPSEVLRSYLFNGFEDQRVLNRKISSWLTPTFGGDQVLVSKNKNYELIKLRIDSSLFESKNVIFQKISPVKYNVTIRGASDNQNLVFKERFGSGWKLYPEESDSFETNCSSPISQGEVKSSQCQTRSSVFSWNDILFFFQKDLKLSRAFKDTTYVNAWLLNQNLLKAFSPAYSAHQDGTFDMSMTVFFYPQLFFYLGLLISLSSFFILFVFALKQERTRSYLGK